MKKKRRLDGLSILWWVCLITIGALIANVAIKTSIIAHAEVAPVQPDIRGMYGTYIDDVADQYHICPELLEAMIERESNGQADAVSTGGDIGLMQVNPKWHRNRMDKLYVTDLTDPYSNMVVAADYLLELFEQYGDLPMVLMVYNGSSDAQERWESGNYTEYAVSIMERTEELEREKEHGNRSN